MKDFISTIVVLIVTATIFFVAGESRQSGIELARAGELIETALYKEAVCRVRIKSLEVSNQIYLKAFSEQYAESRVTASLSILKNKYNSTNKIKKQGTVGRVKVER
ncbi:MAG: hypothetical protein KAT46_05325 [Deltaproteobacteria bacterium]|nr:hypothetical protein [Deltaproteobacteria bacterium]